MEISLYPTIAIAVSIYLVGIVTYVNYLYGDR